MLLGETVLRRNSIDQIAAWPPVCITMAWSTLGLPDQEIVMEDARSINAADRNGQHQVSPQFDTGLRLACLNTGHAKRAEVRKSDGTTSRTWFASKIGVYTRGVHALDDTSEDL